MSDRLVVLVPDDVSAKALIARYTKEPRAVWVCADPRAEDLLETAGIRFIPEEEIFEGKREVLRRWDQEAIRLSKAWFKDLVPPVDEEPDFNPGEYLTRSFYYFLTALFRAFVLLESVQDRFGEVRVATTAGTCKHSLEERLYWVRELNPMAFLLECFAQRWGFDAKFIESPEAVQNTVSATVYRKHRPWMSALWRLAARFKKGEIWCFGNPRLFGPVIEEVRGRGKNRIRQFGFSPLSARSVIKTVMGLGVAVPDGSDAPEGINFNLDTVHEDLRKRAVFTAGGTDFWPVVSKIIRPYLKRRTAVLLQVRRELRRLYRKYKPSLVAVDEDTTDLSRVAVLEARRSGIRTMVLAHGMPVLGAGFTPLCADQITVWSEDASERMQSWGVPKGKIRVTGCPKYDRLFARRGERAVKRRKIRKELGWDEKSPMVLVAPQGTRPNVFSRTDFVNPPAREIQNLVRWWVRIAKQVPGVNVMIKFHDGTFDPAVYDRLIFREGGAPPNFCGKRDRRLLDYLMAADVLMTEVSSAGCEAYVLGVPFVYMKYAEFDDVFKPEDFGSGAVLRSYDQTLQFSRDLAAGAVPISEWLKKQEDVKVKHVYSMDGRSAARVADVLEDGCTNSAPLEIAAMEGRLS